MSQEENNLAVSEPNSVVAVLRGLRNAGFLSTTVVDRVNTHFIPNLLQGDSTPFDWNGETKPVSEASKGDLLGVILILS